MKKCPDTPFKTPDLSGLSAAEVAALVAGLQQQVASQQSVLKQRDQYIQLLEEKLRLQQIQKFAARSEKSARQAHFFDEPELEAEIDALRNQLPDDVEADVQDAPRVSRQRRQRGFSDDLVRERTELTLSEEQKAGATQTFFHQGQRRAPVYPCAAESTRILARKSRVLPGGQ